MQFLGGRIHNLSCVFTLGRRITPKESALGIEAIDDNINEELNSLRGMIETFLKNPEPRTWIPPASVTSSDRDFLTNL